MQLTLEIEPDLYVAAESLAKEEHRTVSAMMNRLLKRGIAATIRPPSGQPEKDAESGPAVIQVHPLTGLPIVKGRRLFDSEDVYHAEAEDDFR